MNYLDTKIQWYNNGIYNNIPNGVMTLRQFATNIITPSKKLLNAFERLHKATKENNSLEKDNIKKEDLFFTTPSVIVEGMRRYTDITSFTPFVVAEYDKIEHPEVLRDYIFEKFKSCIFAFCSPSGTGAKFIFRIPKVTCVEEYKEYYWGLAHYLDKFRNLDTANQNCILPLFTSYDPNAKLREDAEEFIERGYKENAFNYNSSLPEIQGEYNKDFIKKSSELIKHLIGNISENGHPQVRSHSLKFGGWVTMYGGDSEKAWEYLKNLIENNEYLSKGTAGYLKTAKLMFNNGLKRPIIIYENKDKQSETKGIAPAKGV